MKRFICIFASLCLALIGLSSCSWFETDSKMQIQATLTCHYPEAVDQRASADFEAPYSDVISQSSRKDAVVGNIIDELREEVSRGFSTAELILKYYTQYGVYRNTETYSIWWSSPDNAYLFELVEQR